MKSILIFASLFLSTITAYAADLSTYIVNGTSTTASSYPAFVNLFYYRQYSTGYVYGMYCGGTMLDSTHVLTAAHCITDEDSQNNESYMLYTVVAQVDNLSDFPSNATYVRAKSFYYPDDYEYSSTDLWPNDIAIIELESELNVSGSSTLPTDDSYRLGSDGTDDDVNDYSFTAIGHGKTSTNSSVSDELLKTSMDYVSNDTCQGDLTNLNDSQLCFKGSDTNTSTNLSNGICSGDSGGPIYTEYTGSLVQVGITSFGPSTCGSAIGSSGVDAVFTEVYDYEDWIQEVIDGNVTAKYTATDAEREAYAESSSSSSSSDTSSSSSDVSTTSSSSGGGSITWWGLIALGMLAAWRRSRLWLA
ncbi:S1 family peptidase [Vibrio porteresiae]|uniref:Serine protease n=1 Tax=Vibrio porteresiae DSM 19223 TaxID=1123496 RepID=A0ABZ0QI90_9VIBR|nr:serine protease [Vibrio porteresiae]WPC75525.1 serine protease [Vibrio porteresiae DSM 19223]